LANLHEYSHTVAGRVRKARSGKFSYDAAKALQKVRAASIDGYLRPAKAATQIRGVTATRPSPLLRTSIAIRRAGDEVEAEPGFFEGNAEAHCGPVLKGEFARTLNLTDVHAGWVFTCPMRNNAPTHVLAERQATVGDIPFEVTGPDFDNGTEFHNKPVISWAGARGIYFTRSRRSRKNDQAAIESMNMHLVRRYGFSYRYSADAAGRRTRIYDTSATRLDRLLASGVLAPAQRPALVAYRDSLSPARIARDIAGCQRQLLVLAQEKTEPLYLATFPPRCPTSTWASASKPPGHNRTRAVPAGHRHTSAGTSM
jgi:hypothetical protein